MFESSNWIALESGKIASWKGFLIDEDNEADMKWKNDADFINRERGSILFRRQFDLGRTVRSANLAICGLGFYDVYINGELADPKRVLAPLVSNYFKYCKYDVYNVTGLLKQGENVIAVEVCGGLFTAANENYWGWRQMFHGNPRLIAQLDMIDEVGENITVVTDTENWKSSHGAVTESCIYDGEKVDLNLVQKGWNTACFDDSTWKNAIQAESPTEELIECVAPPIRIIDTVSPIKSWKLSDTEIVYDFGTNTSSIPTLCVKGKKGDKVTLNYSEFLLESGELDEASMHCGGSINTDIFTLTGERDVCQPRFAWRGYRYCKVTLSNPEIAVEKMLKNVIHSDVEITGKFECSESKINLLHEAYLRTQIACLMGYPVDCNQRAERMPWLGDVAVTVQECIHNVNVKELFRSFLEDLKRDRSPSLKTIGFMSPSSWRYDDSTSIDWNLAYPIMLDECFMRYGDKTLLEAHYDTLKEHAAFYISHSEKGMLFLKVPKPLGGDGEGDATTYACWFGDWFTLDFPEGTQKIAFAAGSDNHRQNPSFLGTVFYIWLLRLCEKIAKTLKKTDDAENYAMLRAQAIQAVRDKYYDKEKHIFGSGGQFLLTIALAEHIVPEEDRQIVFNHLLEEIEKQNYHSIMGIYGLRLLPEVLESFNRTDIWFKMLSVEDYPSPLFMIARGQTTIAEELEGGGNGSGFSGCHPMFASPDASLYRLFGGIRIDRREENSIIIKPYCPQEWEFVRCSQRIDEGEVASSWKRENGKIIFDFTIPKNCKANVYLENGEQSHSKVYAEGTYSVTL